MYDVIIVGGGPAGLSAGIYTARAKLKTLLIDNYGIHGQIAMASLIENYPGFHEGINGLELLGKLKSQAKKFGIEEAFGEVTDIEHLDKGFKIITSENTYQTLSIIIATGGRPKMLNIPGEERLKGFGISYCATCDAALFRNKYVIVVGGGNTAIGDAIFITKFSEKVMVIHRRAELRASKILQEKAFANEKIEFLLNTNVLEIGGKDKVENILVENTLTKEKRKMDCDGVFVFIGYVPNTEMLKNTISLDELGYVIADEEMKTSQKGIFACGDCRKKLLKQVITASSDGAVAAYSAEKYVENLKKAGG
ncbi:MAG: thioredoxin-disulfide reductase [Elusimicrobia bacterium RIFOXYC2_FULL_34_12]|nr:MAG: thioredoxin-disulfide reductase [Elusimicrobia bacterium RIFOXYC2_FULL_34_12]OGS39006.1 MAG: thioredoxin-disulfide reductase [Elusimicrobia bacterium RIFOXYD2_FULL_34_30]HAM39667.1 thioredoxin-disulfide reductase [Elusimicrobiota bacterium]